MKLFDVNILVHAHRAESPGHAFYREWLLGLADGREPFFYCEWILSAFVRITTHPRIFRTPSPITSALQAAEHIRARPNGIPLMPGARHWKIFEGLCQRSGVVGNLIPDAYLAALAIEADAEWVTADRDFERFEPDLKLTLLRP